VLLRLLELQQRSELPRRMPCEKNTQVAGTLLPQDKESFDSVTSHEENVIFHFRGVLYLPLQSTCQRRGKQKRIKNNILLEKNLKKACLMQACAAFLFLLALPQRIHSILLPILSFLINKTIRIVQLIG
jgi:hypothetical protein